MLIFHKKETIESVVYTLKGVVSLINEVISKLEGILSLSENIFAVSDSLVNPRHICDFIANDAGQTSVVAKMFIMQSQTFDDEYFDSTCRVVIFNKHPVESMYGTYSINIDDHIFNYFKDHCKAKLSDNCMTYTLDFTIVPYMSRRMNYYVMLNEKALDPDYILDKIQRHVNRKPDSNIEVSKLMNSPNESK